MEQGGCKPRDGTSAVLVGSEALLLRGFGQIGDL